MSPRAAAALVVLVVLGFLGLQSVYTVNQREQAIVLQFGDPREVRLNAGLYFKYPIIQNVVYLEKRLLVLDQKPEEVVAIDRNRLIVDSFARFQIVDPLKFFQTVRNEPTARQRLSGFLTSNMRRVLGGYPTEEIVSGRRSSLMGLILEGLNREAEAAGLGVVIKDVRIRRVDLPQENSQAVVERMRSERQQEAARYRAEGEEQARFIRAEAERTQTVIVARAKEEGEIKRGQGDALRNAIFACAFGADPDFFAFYRSMQAYEQAFQSQDTTMVLSPESDFFQFFLKAQRDLPTMEGDQRPERLGADRPTTDDRCRADGSYDLSGIDFLSASAAENGTPPLEEPTSPGE